MDYDLPLILSSLQNDKEWESVDVSGSLIANSGVYNIKANGIFIFLSTPTTNSNILFIPNYVPIPDTNARKPTAHLQSLLIPKIRHTFVFSDQNQVMDFVDYVYRSNVAIAEFIKKSDITDYLVGDQISGIFSPTNQKLTELMVISQVQFDSIIFQTHILTKNGVLPGITFTLSRNSYVSPIYEIPKNLKKEKDILIRSFTIFSIDNPSNMLIFLTKNESEMIRIVMAFYVSIIFSSNKKQISGIDDRQNLIEIVTENELRNNRQKKESFIKKALDDQCSFNEILDKTVFTEKVAQVPFKEIQTISPFPFSQPADYKNFFVQPSPDEVSLDIPENEDNLNYNILQNNDDLFDEKYYRFDFDYMQHKKNSKDFISIDQLGNNDDPLKDIELIENVLNNGIKEKGTNGAWKVLCDISEKGVPQNNTNIQLDNLIKIINLLKTAENGSELLMCKTPLQDLIRIGIEKKLLHSWILLTLPYKEIVQKYFNPESTLLDPNELNYCAFIIYNYIK